jgi:murein DD-endopeptidase MepM/ murein hydrolase activator NlpD
MISPIKRHSGLKVVVSQKYGEVANNAWYKQRGIDIPFHNGIDLVLSGSPLQTFGSEIVACFDGQVVRNFWGGEMNSHGNGLVLRGDMFYENGIAYRYEALYWHLSGLNTPFASRIGIGSCIGYVGNSGDCKPAPTVINPWGGSHLHFGVIKYRNDGNGWFVENKDNGVDGFINPLPLIDDLQGLEGMDTGVSRDLAPIRYFINKLIGK